jgi:hypothetical protein
LTSSPGHVATILRSRLTLGAALAFVAALSFSGPAWAQGLPGGGRGLGPPGGFAPPSGGSSSKKKAKKPEEETHAASNTEAQQSLQTQEPQLPQNPNEVPKELREKIGTDDAREKEKGRGPTLQREFYGLYYREQSGGYKFQTVIPPLWMQRNLPDDRASIFGFYYNRRGKDHDADVLFPFFWKLRDENTKTTVVLPFVHREREAKKDASGQVVEPGRHDNWVVPLAFSGESDDGKGYFYVPPLLTVTQHSARGGLNVAGPMFCKWKGGPTCDRRTADQMDMGLAPFYFFGKDEKSEYEVIPPLIHYYKYSEVGDKSLNVWGPVVLEHTPDKETVDVLPFVCRSWGKNEASTTVLPLFHYSYKGDTHLLVTPLFVTAKGEDKSETVASWVYAKYRGRTELDMITPFWWQYRDPDIGLDRKLLVPFFYQNSSPRSKDTVVFPFYARFQRAGISDQTWVTPLFRHIGDVTGWETDIFPAIWFGRKNDTTHTIVAPFLWDFASPHSRITVAAPFFVRIVDDKSVLQIAGNTFYREKQVPGGTDWEFHFFPIFSYGQSPTGHWWNVLYGLAGYTRDGTTSKLRTFYIPITLSE